MNSTWQNAIDKAGDRIGVKDRTRSDQNEPLNPECFISIPVAYRSVDAPPGNHVLLWTHFHLLLAESACLDENPKHPRVEITSTLPYGSGRKETQDIQRIQVYDCE